MCDGYSAYLYYDKRQRCWSHILRDSRHLCESHRDCADVHVLHGRLKRLYDEAVGLRRLGLEASAPHEPRMRRRAMEIAAAYRHAGFGFGNTLANAAPCLFTFMVYPGVEPTNNAAERELRPVVLHRKMRGKLVSPSGMRMFGTLMTCLLTWRKRGLDVGEELRRIALGAT